MVNNKRINLFLKLEYFKKLEKILSYFYTLFLFSLIRANFKGTIKRRSFAFELSRSLETKITFRMTRTKCPASQN